MFAIEEEAREFCERIYREVGVTPALRAAYEFYKSMIDEKSSSIPRER